MTEDIRGFWSIYKVIAGVTLPIILGLNIAGYHYSVIRVNEAQATYQGEQLYTVDITGKEPRCIPTDSDNGVTAQECEALALKAMRRK